MLTVIPVNVNPKKPRFAGAGKIEYFLKVDQERLRRSARILEKRFNLELPRGANAGPYEIMQSLTYKFVRRWGTRNYDGDAKYLQFADGITVDEYDYYNSITLARNPENKRSQNPTAYAGVMDNQTYCVIFDIDKGSKYQSPSNWADLSSFLERLGLTLHRYRSSHTDLIDDKPSKKSGWHVYAFFTKAEDTATIKRFFTDVLNDNGFTVENGQLEIHPGNSLIKLPLQEGFKPLGRTAKSHTQIVKQFIHRMVDTAFNFDRLNDCLPTPIPFKPSCEREAAPIPIYDAKGVIREHIDRAKEFLQYGLTKFKTTHNTIMALSHYYWYVLGSNNEARATRIFLDLSEKHNGYCKLINQGNWDRLKTEIMQCVAWRPSAEQTEYDPTLSKMIASAKQQTAEAHRKLHGAISQLVKNGQAVTFNAVKKLSGCANATVSKYKNLWANVGTLSQYVGGMWDIQDSFEFAKAQLERFDRFTEQKSETGSIGNEAKPSWSYDGHGMATSSELSAKLHKWDHLIKQCRQRLKQAARLCDTG